MLGIERGRNQIADQERHADIMKEKDGNIDFTSDQARDSEKQDDLVKIAILISGGGTNLQALIDFEKAGKLKSGKLALVVSNNENAYGLERAQKAGIETAVVKKYSKDACGDICDNQRDFEGRLIALLEEKEIDMIVLAGFMVILTNDFVAKYPERIINVHPSLIPSFCGEGYYGLRVHEAALSYGVKVSGATVHFVNEVADGGRIISQKAVDVCENDTPQSLQKRIMEQAEWVLLPEATERVAREILQEKSI